MRYLIALLFCACAYGQICQTATVTTSPSTVSFVCNLLPLPTLPAVTTGPAPTGLPPLPSGVTVPALPKAFVDTTYPVTTRTVAVHAGDNLQAALTAAKCGDNLVLDAGASWTGNFTAAAVCTAATKILVSSSAIASLPAGIEVQQSQVALTPTLITPNTTQALGFAPGAAFWYFAGIGVTIAPGVSGNYNAVVLSAGATSIAALPKNIVFDRCLVRGNGLPSTRGFFADSAGFALINSQVWGFINSYQDTQAVIACAGGPFLIQNNYLEATGENIMFGGCGAAPPAGMVPSDIITYRNNLAKLPAWYHGPPGCGASPLPQCYDVKDNFECKSCQRLLVDSNLMSYAVPQGQGECAIINIFSGQTALDVTFSNNRCEHGAGGFSLNGFSTTATQRILWRNNLLWDLSPKWGNTKGACLLVDGPSANVTIDHNTCINTGTNGAAQAAWIGDQPPSTNTGFTYTNNIAGGPLGANSSNPLMVLQNFILGSVVTNDVFVGDTWPKSCVGCAAGVAYPIANKLWSVVSTTTPSSQTIPCNYANSYSTACSALDWGLVGFVDYAGAVAGTNLAGYALAPTSPYHAAGSDGSDIGANIAAVLAATAGVQ
jgi:hypothetical protein